MTDLAQAVAFAQANLWSFVLVFCRASAALVLLPGFGEEAVPAVTRGILAVPLAALLVPPLRPALPPLPPDVAGLAAGIAGEIACGLLLGWLARTAALALAAAGQVLALSAGLSSVLLPDATFGAQASVPGRLLGIAAPALVFATGLHALPLRALAESYALLPAGRPPPPPETLRVALAAVGQHMALALRLASPFLAIGMLWQAGLGLLARFVPQLQVYFAALPGQVLGALALLALLGGVLTRAWLDALAPAFAFPPGG